MIIFLNLAGHCPRADCRTKRGKMLEGRIYAERRIVQTITDRKDINHGKKEDYCGQLEDEQNTE